HHLLQIQLSSHSLFFLWHDSGTTDRFRQLCGAYAMYSMSGLAAQATGPFCGPQLHSRVQHGWDWSVGTLNVLDVFARWVMCPSGTIQVADPFHVLFVALSY
ncbi:zinc-finger domain of monoamine-oxidase a repressor r1 protein, partial [Moniliophthora roreri]